MVEEAIPKLKNTPLQVIPLHSNVCLNTSRVIKPTLINNNVSLPGVYVMEYGYLSAELVK